jgi:cytochrome c oxidase assembly protein subunit 15
VPPLIQRIRDFRTGPRLMSQLAIAAIVANAGIVVTGGVVRLSKSGLGCPTWPKCTDGDLLPGGANPHTLPHQAIEFGNRLLTFAVLATAALCVLGAWRMSARRRDLILLSWSLVGGVVLQAVVGGLSVRARLNPLTVAPHFLISMVLLYVAVWLHARTSEGDQPSALTVRREIQLGAKLLIAVVAAVEIAGTLVTATGPHAGDPGTKRLDWDPTMITQFHADLVFLYVGLLGALLLGIKATKAPALVFRRGLAVLVVMVLQAVVGYVQYFTHVPAVLVGFHMFGATLATIATARLFFATRDRGPMLIDAVDPAANETQPSPAIGRPGLAPGLSATSADPGHSTAG